MILNYIKGNHMLLTEINHIDTTATTAEFYDSNNVLVCKYTMPAANEHTYVTMPTPEKMLNCMYRDGKYDITCFQKWDTEHRYFQTA